MNPLLQQRIARGLSQRRLARGADVSVKTIADIERGKVRPRALTLHRLATALHCRVETLMPLRADYISGVSEMDRKNQNRRQS